MFLSRSVFFESAKICTNPVDLRRLAKIENLGVDISPVMISFCLLILLALLNSPFFSFDSIFSLCILHLVNYIHHFLLFLRKLGYFCNATDLTFLFLFTTTPFLPLSINSHHIIPPAIVSPQTNFPKTKMESIKIFLGNSLKFCIDLRNTSLSAADRCNKRLLTLNSLAVL